MGWDKYKTGIHESSFRYASKYIMDLDDFEGYILPMMRMGKQKINKQTVFIVDEIGKFELYSKRFERAAERILNNQDYIVMAVVPLNTKNGFVQKVKRRKDSKLFTMTQNRNKMASYIQKCVCELIDAKTSNL